MWGRMTESLKNAVVQRFKDGSISLSTLRLLKTSMSAEELKSFINSAIDNSGKTMMDLTSKKEIADFLVSAGASRTDKSYAESKNISTGPSQMRKRFENRDNIPDFPDVPKTTSQFGTVQSQSTLDKGAEGINITSAQYVLLENLKNPKTNFDAFKKIMESNAGKFFRDNINADLDGKGNTLLHLVQNDEIREYLVAEHKANARARNNEGKTYNGRTDSKGMEFVPNTKPMETLRFETKVNSPKPAMTNQYGLAPALTDEEAKHALPPKDGIPVEHHKPKFTSTATFKQTVVTTTTQTQTIPATKRLSGSNRAENEAIGKVVTAIKNSNIKELEALLGDSSNKFIKDKINLPFDNRGVKLIDFATNRKVVKVLVEHGAGISEEQLNKLPKLADIKLDNPTKKSMLRDKLIKAKLAAKEGVKKFVDKVTTSSKNDRIR